MDMAQQKAETLRTFREIAAMEPLPERGRVAFQFVAEDPGADWDGFGEAVEDLGYDAEGFEAVDDDEEDCLEIITPEMALTAEGLWAEEEKLTLLAAVYGFIPDGWGFVGA